MALLHRRQEADCFPFSRRRDTDCSCIDGMHARAILTAVSSLISRQAPIVTDGAPKALPLSRPIAIRDTAEKILCYTKFSGREPRKQRTRRSS